jgi:hypothetical protein
MPLFNLPTSLTPSVAIQVIEGQLAKRSVVTTRGADNSLTSASIALPLLSPDRRAYSRDNWIGLNPFVYLSSIVVSANAGNSSETRVAISVSLVRLWVCASVCVATILPILGANLGVGIVALALVGFGVAFVRQVVVGKLVPAEILKALQGAEGVVGVRGENAL